MNKEITIKRIIEIEYDMFSSIDGPYGRSECQDNFKTFSIMRKAQFDAWSDDMISEYLNECNTSVKAGRNHVAEKYAFMMKYTHPEEYDQIKASLCEPDENTIASIEKIVKNAVFWQKSLALDYPGLMRHGRAIETAEDTPCEVSFETYLRGELYTYTKTLIQAYETYIHELDLQGRNLPETILENTIHAYGYKTLKDAEKHYLVLEN